MSTIGQNFKQAINNNFKHNMISRDAESIFAALNVGVKDSDNMVVLPKVEKIELTKIDDLHDKLSLSYDDGKDVEGTITWRKSADGKQFVFSKFE